MRVKPFLTAVTLSAISFFIPFAAWSQAHGGGGMSGGHAAAPAAHMGGIGHAAGPVHSPISSTPAPHPSGLNPGSRPGYTAHPMNQGYGGNAYQGGNWTSAGFIPNSSARNSYGNSYGSAGRHTGDGRGRDRHVGYGYGVGYGFIPYADGYNTAFDLNYDPNDPNQQQVPSENYADNAPPAPESIAPGEAGYPPYGPPAYAQDTARPPYRPGAATSPQQGGAPSGNSASDGLGHPKVTLVFKDGRPPVKIQNYAMSQTKIFVRDNGTDRDIAIGDLDVPATMAANDQAGVDFELPVKH